MTHKIEAIERLGKLLDEGKITRSDYEILKREIVGSSGFSSDPREVGSTPTQVSPPMSANPSSLNALHAGLSKRTDEWRFWVGLVLAIIGGIGVMAAVVRFSNEPVQTLPVLLVNLILDPLVWGGVFGAFLLVRWKQAAGLRENDAAEVSDRGYLGDFRRLE